MNDDTDKLAAQMRNLKPSKKSRESGLDAAMAAFGKEFAVDTTQASAAVSANVEKNSESTQGLADEPRPTGMSTKTVRATTRRVETMTKLTNIFNFKPQTMMMAGTCSAALIAAMIVIPSMNDFSVQEQMVKAAPAETVAEIDAVQMVPSVGRVEPTASAGGLNSRLDVIISSGGAMPPSTAQAPKTTSGPVATTTAEPNSISIRAELKKRNAENQSIVDSITMEDIGTIPELSVEETLQRIPGIPIGQEPQGGITSPTPPPAIVSRNSPAVAPAGGSYAAPNAADLVEKFGDLTLEQSPAEFKTITETVVTHEASTELVTIPAEYETVLETVVVQEASRELVVIPGKYEWVEGDIEGSAIELKSKPAQYETVSETIVVQEASTELVSIPATFETVQETVIVRPAYATADGSVVPAITKEVSRRVIKTPASTQERKVPAVTKTQTRRVVKTPASVVEENVPFKKRFGKTRVQITPASTAERSIPAVTKTVSRRVIKTPARTQERIIPSAPRTIERQVLVTPPKFYLRDDDGNVVREFESRDAFEIYKANIPTVVEETPVSTFSVDVDTASYSFLRASINRGQLPPRSSIRLEEMINYFPYDYDAPKSADEPFKANVTVTPNPWNEDTKLMHIGIKGYVPPANERPNSNIVLLIDTSGSMRAQNKLPLLINSFKLLLNTLDEDDTVSIVTYAGSAGTVLEPTPANEKNKIKAALENLRSGGSTAGAAGLELAYNKALETFDEDGVNRVILATDGDFNVGFSSPDEMKAYVEEKRETGVFLSVLGFGMGNYNDHLMQSLAQNGNGVAAYIDTLAEANKVLANEAGSALFTIAKDVKIQVEFNPSTVAEYRLIGYETRALKRQDFNNDKVDAGEIGAGHSVTAIYEMTPVGSPAITVDKLRYVSDEDKPKSTRSDEYAFVKIRHKLPNADKSTLQTFPIGKRQERSMRRASDDMRFATAVAAVGQKLRGDPQLDDFSYGDAIKLASKAKGDDENGCRAEFIQLVRLIDTMEK